MKSYVIITACALIFSSTGICQKVQDVKQDEEFNFQKLLFRLDAACGPTVARKVRMLSFIELIQKYRNVSAIADAPLGEEALKKCAAFAKNNQCGAIHEQGEWKLYSCYTGPGRRYLGIKGYSCHTKDACGRCQV